MNNIQKLSVMMGIDENTAVIILKHCLENQFEIIIELRRIVNHSEADIPTIHKLIN